MNINEIRLSPQSRNLDPKHVKRITESIKEYGLINPIMVEKGTNLLIDGRYRLEAAKQLGWTNIEVTIT